MMALRQGLLAQLAQRWPWVGVVAGIFPVVRSMFNDGSLRNDEGEIERPIIACLLLVTPRKQMTYVTADLVNPLNSADLRRVNYLWSQLGREACYKLLDAMKLQGMGVEVGERPTADPAGDFDGFVSGLYGEPQGWKCPKCGAPWNTDPPRPSCACKPEELPKVEP